MTMKASQILRTQDGRLRLGWRLLGFTALAVLIAVAVAALTPPGVVGGAVAMLAGAVLSGWWWLRIDGHGPASLGFYASREAPAEVGKGLVLGVLIGLLVVGLMALFGGLRWSPDDGAWSAWVTGAAASLLFTSVAFGLLHLGNPGAGTLSVANVAAAGLLLGVVYVRTASLWWATGAHLGWNWAHGFLADVPVSGLDVSDTPFYDGVVGGPEWVGGGSFGPEGSVLTTVVVVTATIVLWRGPWLRPGAAARAARPMIALPSDDELLNGI